MAARLCFLLLSFIAAASGADPREWIPASWGGGPLEIWRRTQSKTLPADQKIQDSLRRWYEQDTLDLLKDSPINCLLVTWSAGADAASERQHQRLAGDYVQQARGRGIAVLGTIHAGADIPRAVAQAAEAKLDGVVVEGAGIPSQRKDLLVIPMTPLERVPRSGEWPVVAISDSLWPRIRPLSPGATSGPTGDPWLDSNSWRVRSLRAGRPAPAVWLGHFPDGAAAQDYPRAVADAAMAGGHWIVALDDELRARLREKQPEALAVWRRTMDHLRFYRDRAEWRGLEPRAKLAIVQDAAGKNAAMSGENLNLFTRRHLPYRVIERAGLAPAALAGLDAVVAVDLDPPASAERQVLQAFADAGGTVVAAPSWKPQAAGAKPYAVETVGKGRVVVYRRAVPDPFMLSLDVLTLLGRANLEVRLFNVAPVISFVSGNGNRVLVQMVNYATLPLETVTVRVRGDFRSARLYDPEAAPVALSLDRSDGGVEVAIPKVSITAAVLLE